MVVDDERDILKLIASYLRKRGIQNDSFSDPVEALDHFKQNPSKYEIVLSDVRMPVMSGLDLAGHLKVANPGVKIFLMSAFGFDSHMHRLQAEHRISEFIEKPFTLRKLGMVLDRHLGPNKGGMSLLFF